ncbi:MAG: serine hydrolase [Pseudomonadales bacterium]|nr:serine hydrolase [Pseudomonadales bacterium]
MSTLKERNTQLCVYVDELCVVDLWAKETADTDFDGDSLVNVFSSGKSLEAILLAVLCDRGLLNYDAKIAVYWPEFGACNKGDTSVADLMRHEAGLAAFDISLPIDALLPEQLRDNSIAPIIEQQNQRFRKGTDSRREYHAITRGWIANELFRRVEPAGRTMGQFLRAEISQPLDLDVFIGLRDEELSRVSHVTPLGIGYQAVQSIIPKAFGRKIELNVFQIIARLTRFAFSMKDRSNKQAPTPFKDTKLLSRFDTPELCKGESPSAGAKCSARGLAKLAAVMANRGSFQDHQVLSETAHATLHANPTTNDMGLMRTTFSQGGVALFSESSSSSAMDTALNNGREGYVGWFGLGGSIFQWHLEHRIGFAYVPTSLNVLDIVNERGKAYQDEVLRCVAGQRADECS